MESSQPQSVDHVPEPVKRVAPAKPDGTPPYADPAPDEMNLFGPDKSLLDSRPGRSGEASSRTDAAG